MKRWWVIRTNKRFFNSLSSAAPDNFPLAETISPKKRIKLRKFPNCSSRWVVAPTEDKNFFFKKVFFLFFEKVLLFDYLRNLKIRENALPSKKLEISKPLKTKQFQIDTSVHKKIYKNMLCFLSRFPLETETNHGDNLQNVVSKSA